LKGSNNNHGKRYINNYIGNRFNGTCYYCGKRGHVKSECRKLENKLEQIKPEAANLNQEIEDEDVV